MSGTDILRRHRGSISKIAKAIGKTQSTVSQWRKIPAEYAATIEATTGIPRHELRPDIFQAPAETETKAA